MRDGGDRVIMFLEEMSDVIEPLGFLDFLFLIVWGINFSQLFFITETNDGLVSIYSYKNNTFYNE